MSRSQSSAPPPEYTRQDPAPLTPSTLLGSPSHPTNEATASNVHSQSDLPSEHYSSKLTTSTTTTSNPDYDRPPSPTPSSQTTASTILPTYAQTGSYKGFPSEAAYLAALTEWAETKKYIQPSEEGQTLSGFFGYKTMEEYTGQGTKQDTAKKDERRASHGDKEREKQGFMGFLKKMAKKDEGGGHERE
ncbi:hypothetical protein D6D02_08070 [Aureobasidium pullulans]|nr:hypothetical protein D6D26_10065 [Aureobasidium pullulans]THY03995.1 hypothetical protein D6D02_08070 [Aureobasidium pullulans]TIA05828.1 hypothetical protein D6C81_10245 [Aureobasidium pullulans]TIA45414.1 hypothetical protein D6C79_05696 [Aureobasidium pullulans]